MLTANGSVTLASSSHPHLTNTSWLHTGISNSITQTCDHAFLLAISMLHLYAKNSSSQGHKGRLGNPWLSNCFTLTYMTKIQTKNTTTNHSYWESVSHLHFLHMMSAFSLHFKLTHYVHSYIDCIHYEIYKDIEKYNPCSEKFIPNWPTWRLLHSSHMVKGFMEMTFKDLKHSWCGTFAGRKH